MISKTTACLAICFACVSYVFYKKYSSPEYSTASPQFAQTETVEKMIIDSWTRTIKPPPIEFKKLVVGINSNTDIIVSGVALLQALKMPPGGRKDNAQLENLHHLQETFSHFLAKGSAAERPFMDQIVYQKVIQTAETLNDVEFFAGGNAALMAQNAAKLFPFLKIHFVGPVGPLLESLLPKSLEIPASCRIPRDEVHLIMEYKVGEKWGDKTAPVANRFITSHDMSNSQILMMETFFDTIKIVQPDLILLSGLSLMEGQSSELFHHRLSKLVSLSQQIPKSTPIHLELASMATSDFVKEIMEKVVPNVDSLGLNEQEMMFSSKVSSGPYHDHFDSKDHSQPIIHKISDIMLWLLKTYGKSAQREDSRLTRIHFHSLTYHIVGVLEGSWSNVEASTAAGTQVAGLQACDIPDLQEDLVKLQIPEKFKLHSEDFERKLDPKNPIYVWRKDGFLFVFSPVLVCKNPVKTVGLGDAISATGLIFSQFH